jgi:hypothetical protein
VEKAVEDLEVALKTAAKEGFDIVIVDSLSHFWIGDNG